MAIGSSVHDAHCATGSEAERNWRKGILLCRPDDKVASRFSGIAAGIARSKPVRFFVMMRTLEILWLLALVLLALLLCFVVAIMPFLTVVPPRPTALELIDAWTLAFLIERELACNDRGMLGFTLGLVRTGLLLAGLSLVWSWL